MAKKELKWSVQPAPTGKWKAFHHRGWPTADYTGTDTLAVVLICEDDYRPANVKTGRHAPIQIKIADFSRGTRVWRKVLKEAKTLEEAKAIAEEAVKNYPDFKPKALV